VGNRAALIGATGSSKQYHRCSGAAWGGNSNRVAVEGNDNRVCVCVIHNIYIYIYIYIYVCVCVCVFVCAYMYIYIYIYMRILYIYIYIYIYIYTMGPGSGLEAHVLWRYCMRLASSGVGGVRRVRLALLYVGRGVWEGCIGHRVPSEG